MEEHEGVYGFDNNFCKVKVPTLNQVIETIYPVGSIYMSVNNVNPGTLFGVGIWQEWGSGRVPVGVDMEDENNEFNGVEKEGGSREKDLRALIGAVDGDVYTIGYYEAPTAGIWTRYTKGIKTGTVTGANIAAHTTLVMDSNGNYPDSIQPYITCYMWKRTA